MAGKIDLAATESLKKPAGDNLSYLF